MDNQSIVVLIELRESSLNKILQTIKIIEDNNISYSVIEAPLVQNQSRIQIQDTSYYRKLLGNKGYQILQLLSDGHSYKSISQNLDISINCVRYYIKKIFTKLNVHNSRDAVRVFLTEIKR